MTKQPMTEVGVQNKLTELYLLSETALQTEALTVQAYFKEWVKANFTLNTKQDEYLDNLNNQIADYFGSQCSVCFSNKLPVTLIYPVPPITEHSKWTGSSNSLAVKSDGKEKPTATGSLTFEFTYTV
ncbi:MAG TPA: hypothetical protein PK776_06620 [Flavobacterium sp.]|nr:hypothetical protein [Flavobacterium sp.]